MPNKVLLTEMDDTPPQLAFANFAGDFSPTAGNDLRKGTDTQVELVLLNLANNAAAQSAKGDLGANFAERYDCRACIEMQVAAATADLEVGFFWSGSNSSTAATGNDGGASGSAAAYTGYNTDIATSLGQVDQIGFMPMSAEGVDSVQIGKPGSLFPSDRYGMMIPFNKCGQTICDTDDIEAHIVLSPVILEIQ